jgi:hypothetical protein
MVLVVSVEVCYENGGKEERTDDKEVLCSKANRYSQQANSVSKA